MTWARWKVLIAATMQSWVHVANPKRKRKKKLFKYLPTAIFKKKNDDCMSPYQYSLTTSKKIYLDYIFLGGCFLIRLKFRLVHKKTDFSWFILLTFFLYIFFDNDGFDELKEDKFIQLMLLRIYTALQTET